MISAILDENLMPQLLDIPPDLIRVPPELEPEKPILAYKGKKPTYQDAKDLLNDKSFLKDIKDIVLKSSNVTYDIYDDEYDDRDEEESGTTYYYEKNAENDPFKYMENRFEGYELVSDPSESSSEDEYEATSSKVKRNEKQNNKGQRDTKNKEQGEAQNERKREQRGQKESQSKKQEESHNDEKVNDNFCEDPSVLRARREAQRRNNKGGKNFDVVGKPKGQGQESNVLHNRVKKNVQKSSRANHNRKSGSAWKKSKGMF